MPSDDRVLRAVLRFSFDPSTAEKVKRGVISIEDALEQLEMQAGDAMDSLQRLSEGIQIIDIAGSELSNLGRSIVDPLRMAADAYVQQAGRAESASRDWLDASRDLEFAQYQIGRAAAQAVLPTLEKAAVLARTAADFVSENPGIIRAAMNIGAVVAGLGAVGMAVTKGIRLYTDIRTAMMAAQQFAAAKMMDRAADKQLVAAGGMGAASGAGGAGLGAAAGGVMARAGTAIGVAAVAYIAAQLGEAGADIIGPMIHGEGYEESRDEKNVFESLIDTMRLLGASGLAAWTAIGTAAMEEWEIREEHIPEIRKSLIELSIAISGVEQASEEMVEGLEQTSVYWGQALDSYIDYQTDLAETERQLARERQISFEEHERDKFLSLERFQIQTERSNRDFNRDETEQWSEFLRSRNLMIEEFNRDLLLQDKQFYRDQYCERERFQRDEERDLQEYNRDRTRSAEEFARYESESETEYYRDRVRSAEEFGHDIERFEEEHHRRMLESQEDHSVRMRDLARSRDAIGMLQEMRDYEISRRREEEGHQLEAGQRNEDYARQLVDMEVAFAEQRQTRLDEFEYQQGQYELEYQYRREQNRREFETSMAESETEYLFNRNTSKKEFEKRQEESKTEYKHMRELSRAHHQLMLEDMDDDFELEMEMMDEQHEHQLEMMEEMARDEDKVQEKRFADQLRDLDYALLNERDKRNFYYDLMEDDFELWLQNLRGSMRPGYDPDDPTPSDGGPDTWGPGYIGEVREWGGQRYIWLGRHWQLMPTFDSTLTGNGGGGDMIKGDGGKSIKLDDVASVGVVSFQQTNTFEGLSGATALEVAEIVKKETGELLFRYARER
jgi:hypothetical protein